MARKIAFKTPDAAAAKKVYRKSDLGQYGDNEKKKVAMIQTQGQMRSRILAGTTLSRSERWRASSSKRLGRFHKIVWSEVSEHRTVSPLVTPEGSLRNRARIEVPNNCR
jgi:hypothetical protein